jgi:MFS superfamily sulfate permease-like transporter
MVAQDALSVDVRLGDGSDAEAECDDDTPEATVTGTMTTDDNPDETEPVRPRLGGGGPLTHFDVHPDPGMSWRQALLAGWTPELSGVPDQSKLLFYSREVLLGMVISMAQVPQTISFAYLARVRPAVTLHGAWIIGLTCALLGGRPGMVLGTTSAFSAIVGTFLEEPDNPGGNGRGIETISPSVMLAGLFMLLVWALRLTRFIALLQLPIRIGFCNGLAIVIGRAQLHPFRSPRCGTYAHPTLRCL